MHIVPDMAAHRLPRLRPERRRHLQAALQLTQRFFVENDEIELASPDACELQAESNRIGRERLIMLAPGETLLLARRDDDAVANQCRGGIMIVAGDPKDVHSSPP